jgi:thiamine pyrophosphate-dependent acetolactate synthase large subunit-like protein
MKAFEFFARCVVNQKVEHCFALLGDANMQVAAKMADLGIAFTYVQHEHCAIAASMAYARKTQKVGVSTVTCGPGLTQIMTALPAAVRANIPLVVLAGESPLSKSWYNQQIEQRQFVEATGARYIQIHTSQRFEQGIQEAFLMAIRDRMPVVLGTPFDLLHEDMTNSPKNETPLYEVFQSSVSKPSGNVNHIRYLADMLMSAERPIIMAGLGASEPRTSEQIALLAEKCDALLATTLPARGLFHDDPFYLGVSGGFSSQVTRKFLSESDLIVAFGASISSHNSDQQKLWSNARVIQITLDPRQFFQGNTVSDQIIVGDAGQIATELTHLIQSKTCVNRTDENADLIQQTPIDESDDLTYTDGMNPSQAVKEIDQSVPEDWEIVNSSGHCSYYFSHMKNRPFEKFLTIREFGAIGNGLSFALGAAVASGRPTILFDGDGSFLMHVQELETIRRLRLPLISCIFNDGGYGSEFHKLRAEGLREDGANFGYSDIFRIAEGFGIKGYRVDNLVQLREALSDLSKAPRAAVIDIRVSPTAMSPVIARSHGKPSKH